MNGNVGADEADLTRRHVNWTSPLGQALMKAAEGDRETSSDFLYLVGHK